MYELIRSKSNEKIKTVRKLSDKKYRAQYGLFTIEGKKLVIDYLRSGGKVQSIFVTEDALDKYKEYIDSASCQEVYCIPRSLYMYISEELSPQGILAVCPVLTQGRLKEGNCVVLESLRDAGNLGTVIRTATAFGIDNIVLSSDCADLYNSKTLRATMGALFFSNIIVVSDIQLFVSQLKEQGRRVFAAMPYGDTMDIRTVELKYNDCIVIGNEGNGISDGLCKCCSARVTIPMSGEAESLNASSAASVLMWELVRGGNIK